MSECLISSVESASSFFKDFEGSNTFLSDDVEEFSSFFQNVCFPTTEFLLSLICYRKVPKTN